MPTESICAQGPYFDELRVGQVFDAAPPCTLTSGRAAAHQAIVGDRLWLALNEDLAAKVVGGALAHPALVWDVAIGQSTVVTHHVKANLFYRNLVLLRHPCVGDTLRTTTEVVALRENARREGRMPTGLAALRITTVDQKDRPVLDFYRCAMLPLKGSAETGRNDDLDSVGTRGGHDLLASVADWNLDVAVEGTPRAVVAAGDRIDVVGGDVVSNGPELARLTLNIATVHHAGSASDGERLVYGGHTIGIAMSQLTRAFPGLLTVLGWHGCDHLAPVREGDVLTSGILVNGVQAGPSNTQVADLSVEVMNQNGDKVLDWQLVALI
jgi:acyl dehydratase